MPLNTKTNKQPMSQTTMNISHLNDYPGLADVEADDDNEFSKIVCLTDELVSWLLIKYSNARKVDQFIAEISKTLVLFDCRILRFATIDYHLTRFLSTETNQASFQHINIKKIVVYTITRFIKPA